MNCSYRRCFGFGRLGNYSGAGSIGEELLVEAAAGRQALKQRRRWRDGERQYNLRSVLALLRKDDRINVIV
jgi:hypothetical protein